MTADDQGFHGMPGVPTPAICQICGRYPAIHVKLRTLISIIIGHQVSMTEGWFCRDCGVAEYQSHNLATHLFGWWGVAGFCTPIFLLMNLSEVQRLNQLPPPVLDYRWMPAEVGAPLLPGKPLMQRPVILIPPAVVISLVLVLCIFARW